jgi:predicted dehydrogenase
MKVKIYGAGSIGNHLAQASRRMGWSVAVVDKDPKALERMKTDIYPTRYGAWDSGIELFEFGKEPKGGFDVIMLGTPPHVRMSLATELLKEDPKVLQLEKPLCGPGLEGMKEFTDELKKHKTIVIAGYDHAIATSINRVVELIKEGVAGEIITLDVEFREHWAGIFKAHPWLSGPEDTYLGFRTKGGGASGEHSHALHLWQYLAKVSGLGTWKKVAATLKIEKGEKGVEYDSIASFSVETDKGHVGRIIQDVVTAPTRKWIRVQGKDGFIEWYCNGGPKGDLIKWQGKDGKLHEEVTEKTRPDDFYQETKHIQDLIDGKIAQKDSPISFEGALSVMTLLNSVYRHSDKGSIEIS